jgi:hypothetical protein
MDRRDIFCDAAGVLGAIEYGPAGGYAIQQVCKIAYEEVCKRDASKP